MAISEMRNVDWGATTKLAVIRGFASALVLVTIGLFSGVFSGPRSSGIGGALFFLLMWTFGAAVSGICYIWILKAIGATLGRAVGIVTLVTAIMQILVIGLVAAGDPLVYLLNKRVPDLLDLADFKVFNFVAVIFVKKHEPV